MPVQTAYLRAINVGGRRVTMDRLRQIFEGLGFEDVSTYIASGNVSFQSRKSQVVLERIIEAALNTELGYTVETFVRTVPQLKNILGSVPFAQNDVDTAHAVMVTFLKDTPGKGAARAVRALSGPTDRFELIGTELYWLRVTKESDPKIMTSLSRAIGGPMTGRNIKTVKRMADVEVS